MLAASLLAACAPEGPLPVPLDRVACARCGMLVGDARFAGQIHTQGGEVLFYDDPGCLPLHAEERRDDLRAHWFHAQDGERWIPGDEAAFAQGEATPMGYGLGARAPGVGPLDRAAALALARAREAARREAAP
jgi:hypothetical protein